MQILEGKSVAEHIKKNFKQDIESLNIKPSIAVLAIEGDDASSVYIKRIKKNCEQYKIDFKQMISKTPNEFKENFYKVKNDDSITGIMFQQPIPKELTHLVDEIPPQKDVEGITAYNMGRLFLGEKDVNIPCTSKAVIETLDYYNIDLEGKDVVVVGRSNIVGKPLIPQLLSKNATVTVCHSRTQNLREKTSKADIVIMAIGNANFLKKEDIKQGAILIDVGINFHNGKITGDIDYEDISEKASACTPVPGGIGTVTNALLLENIINGCKRQKN